MNQSFYTASLGAMSQQERLNVLSNNIANVNTTGYKSKVSAFSELMYYEMKGKTQADNRLQTGTGLKLDRTDTDFSNQVLTSTGGQHDYGIQGDGFFMLRDPATQEITYTRDGSFSLSQYGNQFYLVNSAGKLVLDQNRNPIAVTDATQLLDIGVFDFANKNGMQSAGENEFIPVAKNGEPFAATQSTVQQGVLEASNVDYAGEMTKIVETQRAYSYSLKMLTTSDEIENTINSLR